jgi:hypothetical protein
MLDLPHYPVIQVRPRLMLVYEHVEYPPRKKKDPKLERSLQFRAKPTYDGLITLHAKRRLRIAIETLVAIALPKQAMNFKLNKPFTFYVNFITLTLPFTQGNNTDQEIKSKILDPWIKKARRRFKLKNYVWRAERQLNGNLHFHFCTDCYMPFDQLRDTWNDNTNALGFIDKFEIKHGHRHPNSTDVHATKKIKDLAAYMVKYCCKSPDTAELYTAQPPWANAEKKLVTKKKDKKFKRLLSLEDQRIEGKVWDCSVNLKGIKYPSTIMDSVTEVSWLSAYRDKSVYRKSTENCTLLFLTKSQHEKHVQGEIKRIYIDWLNSIRNQN